MGTFTFTDENTSSIPPARLFKALVIDSHNLIPKLLPQFFASINITGDGGLGTIEEVNLAAGGNYMKYHVDELNEETYAYKYTLIESGGDEVLSKMEKVTYELKFEDSAEEGGSISSKVILTSTCYPKDEFEVKEEDVKENRERLTGIFKVVEGYLLKNPDAYA